MEYMLYITLLVFYNVVDVLCSTCYRTSSHGLTQILTCSYGCCGSTSTRYCCPRSSSRGGTTAGTVVGVLVVLAIITIILVICKKKRYYHRRGRRHGAVGPHQVQSIQISHTTTVTHPPMYNPAAYPQRYQQPPMYVQRGRPMQRPIPGQVTGAYPASGAPLNPGYVPPPPSYVTPPPPYSAPPPAYNEIQNFPPRKT